MAFAGDPLFPLFSVFPGGVFVFFKLNQPNVSLKIAESLRRENYEQFFFKVFCSRLLTF